MIAPVRVLFDSGASHIFISKECALKLGLEVECLKSSYSIHLPGGQIITNQMTRQVPLQLQGKIYPTYFIVLPTQKVDIILGMNWMEDRGVLLDTLSRIVHIQSSTHGSMTLHLGNPKSLPLSVNLTEGKSLAEIFVVCEYTNVFPEDLPGMPPDRNVEFAIELQPGTAPISRRSY